MSFNSSSKQQHIDVWATENGDTISIAPSSSTCGFVEYSKPCAEHRQVQIERSIFMEIGPSYMESFRRIEVAHHFTANNLIFRPAQQ